MDREARQSDAYRAHLRALPASTCPPPGGYFGVKSTMEFVVKVNASDVAPAFYEIRTVALHPRRFDQDM